MIRDLNPDRAAVVWDMGIPKRRSQLQPEYKQQREEMPDLMRPQIGRLQEVLPLLGIANVGLPDTEADDLIASYAVAAEREGYEVILATNDKDLFQLVGEKVRVYSTSKTDLAAPEDAYALLGVDAVRKKWGVEPDQIGAVLCLTGDSADNIPGVPGLGVKGAAALLRAHGSLDVLLGEPQRIESQRIREKIVAARDQVEQNREMVRLDLDLELPVGLDGLEIRPRYEDLLKEIDRLEFKGLKVELAQEACRVGIQTFAREPEKKAIQGELF
jgi:DNA polymerase-1